MSIARRLGKSRSMFFNAYWLWGAGLLVLIGMITRERALSLLGLLTIITAGGAWLWSRYSLDNLEYSRRLSDDRLFTGERLTMHVTLINRKFLPLAWCEIEDEVADRLRIIDRLVLPSGIPGVAMLRITTSMRWFERATWPIVVECRARGVYSLGPVTLRSGDLFGFFNRRHTFNDVAKVIVYPKIAQLDEISIPPRHLFGDQRIRRQILTDPSRTVGIRDYRPEDSIRHIHWKATARMQSLQTKVFDPTTTTQFGVFLNLDTFERYWEGVDHDRAEGAIVVAATVASKAIDEEYAVGLYANGVVSGSDQALRVKPSRSTSQQEEILTGLAKLSPVASVNFPSILRAETSRFPVGSTIVIITALMTNAIASILEQLVTEGHEIVVITIGQIELPSLRRVRSFSVDMQRLKPYIPENIQYVMRMPSSPVPPLDIDSKDD